MWHQDGMLRICVAPPAIRPESCLHRSAPLLTSTHDLITLSLLTTFIFSGCERSHLYRQLPVSNGVIPQNQEAPLACEFTPSFQSCMTQYQGISSWLPMFNNLSKDWCWGRWPFQWYIIHHQCGLCPLQWWEWCGSMNIYSQANVGGTRLVSWATHSHAHTHARTHVW